MRRQEIVFRANRTLNGDLRPEMLYDDVLYPDAVKVLIRR
ncbi:hypothetical protein AWB76_05223 [Caballeronia temeraria]|uniref:Uncharacterized protein n=1 Tax=Caballeronia temeraria TaxID=1777137 RepID=A0A158C7M3_9BURK|nr:hypothetical protein AWB76_05223 [Caballeronia temeraria]